MVREQVLRRPNFRPGLGVRLADGQSWTIPAPPDRPDAVNARADVEPRGPSPSFGREYGPLLAVVHEAEDDAERRRAELALIIFLLGWNYDLTAAHFARLLHFEADEPARAMAQHAFREVATVHVRTAAPCVRGPQCPESRRARLASFFSRDRRGSLVNSAT